MLRWTALAVAASARVCDEAADSRFWRRAECLHPIIERGGIELVGALQAPEDKRIAREAELVIRSRKRWQRREQGMLHGALVLVLRLVRARQVEHAFRVRSTCRR